MRLVVIVEVDAERGEVVDVDLILGDLPEVRLFLSKVISTYPICSLGALFKTSRGILCLVDINWRKWFVLISSILLARKVFRNFLILREFLVAGFLRFMKLSNIMERSYLRCPPSWSCVLSKPRKRLLRGVRLTSCACAAQRPPIHGASWGRFGHSHRMPLFVCVVAAAHRPSYSLDFLSPLG